MADNQSLNIKKHMTSTQACTSMRDEIGGTQEQEHVADYRFTSIYVHGINLPEVSDLIEDFLRRERGELSIVFVSMSMLSPSSEST